MITNDGKHSARWLINDGVSGREQRKNNQQSIKRILFFLFQFFFCYLSPFPSFHSIRNCELCIWTSLIKCFGGERMKERKKEEILLMNAIAELIISNLMCNLMSIDTMKLRVIALLWYYPIIRSFSHSLAHSIIRLVFEKFFNEKCNMNRRPHFNIKTSFSSNIQMFFENAWTKKVAAVQSYY